MTAIKIDNLVCGYEKYKPIIKNLSLTVKAGDFLGIIGPNGSGKTTLLRALAGLLNIQQGTISLGGRKLAQLNREELAKQLAFVPQLIEPVPGFSVKEFIELGRTPYLNRFNLANQQDEAAVERAIVEVGITELKGRLTTELSGGEFQRAAIARALAQETRILLLDEPTTHLDLYYQIKIGELLQKLQASHTLVATFHDLNIAARFCSRLLLINKGEIVAAGLPDEVITVENIRQAYNVTVEVKDNPQNNRLKYVVLP